MRGKTVSRYPPHLRLDLIHLISSERQNAAIWRWEVHVIMHSISACLNRTFDARRIVVEGSKKSRSNHITSHRNPIPTQIEHPKCENERAKLKVMATQ